MKMKVNQWHKFISENYSKVRADLKDKYKGRALNNETLRELGRRWKNQKANIKAYKMIDDNNIEYEGRKYLIEGLLHFIRNATINNWKPEDDKYIFKYKGDNYNIKSLVHNLDNKPKPREGGLYERIDYETIRRNFDNEHSDRKIKDLIARFPKGPKPVDWSYDPKPYIIHYKDSFYTIPNLFSAVIPPKRRVI